MRTYSITVTANYLVELPELTAEARELITNNYELPVLPLDEDLITYDGGSITYQEVTL